MLCSFLADCQYPLFAQHFAFHWCWSCGLHPYVKYFLVLGWAYEHWCFQFVCDAEECYGTVSVRLTVNDILSSVWYLLQLQFNILPCASVWKKKHCLQYYQAFVKKLWRAKTLEGWNLSQFHTRFVGFLSICEQHAGHSTRNCYDTIRILLVNFYGLGQSYEERLVWISFSTITFICRTDYRKPDEN